MANLRSEINFTTIKPTTKIYTYEIVKMSIIEQHCYRLIITSSNLYLPLLNYYHSPNTSSNYYMDDHLTEQVFNTEAKYKTAINKTNLELLELFDDKIKTFVNYKTDYAVYKKFTEYIFETYFINISTVDSSTLILHTLFLLIISDGNKNQYSEFLYNFI